LSGIHPSQSILGNCGVKQSPCIVIFRRCLRRRTVERTIGWRQTIAALASREKIHGHVSRFHQPLLFSILLKLV
jgi:hypothetical protein